MDTITQAKPYNLVLVPDVRLNQKSADVLEINDEVRECMDRLLATIHANQGIGISAVQVGIMKRIVVIDIDGVHKKLEQDHIPGMHGGKPLYMVNPELIEKSTELETMDEGCMSVPNVYVNVTRSAEIKVKYLDYEGKEQTLKVEKGLLSACIQHEIDHTNGVIILDYLSPLKRQMQMKKVEKYKKLLQRTEEKENLS